MDGYSRSSNASTHIPTSRQPLNNKPPMSVSNSNSNSDLAREQRARGDLEGKLTGMERRLQGLEKELEDSSRRERWERERSRELEEEVRGLKERAGGHASALRSVQREVEVAQSQLDSERQRAEGKRREDQAEVVKWRQQCEMLEDELQGFREGQRLQDEQNVSYRLTVGLWEVGCWLCADIADCSGTVVQRDDAGTSERSHLTRR